MNTITELAKQVFKERNRQNTGTYIEDAFAAIGLKFNECHSSDGTFCSSGGGGGAFKAATPQGVSAALRKAGIPKHIPPKQVYNYRGQPV